RYAYPDSRPMEIYTDVHAYDRVVRGVLRMADNESTHLRGGFFPLEPWGGGIRWTGPEARAVLKYAGERKAAVAFNTGTARRGPSVRGSVTVGDENGARSARQEFEVPSDSWQTVVAPVPEGLRDRVWVTITVDNPMVPGELDRGGPDGRSLGGAVREIALTGPRCAGWRRVPGCGPPDLCSGRARGRARRSSGGCGGGGVVRRYLVV